VPRIGSAVEGCGLAGAASPGTGAHQRARVSPGPGRRHHRVREATARGIQERDGAGDRGRAGHSSRRGRYEGKDQRRHGIRGPRRRDRRVRRGRRGGTLIEDLLARLASWPPLLIYAVIALSVVVENFFPPSPSDIFVLLAAFLAHRGSMRPLTIFLVAWGFGFAGAILVYWSALRFGRRFLQWRLGRRLVTAGSVAAVEREYLRFGLVGIFFFRMLPAFRAVVAPFAGLVNLRPARTLPPIALACAVWYGALILIGTQLGENWEQI